MFVSWLHRTQFRRSFRIAVALTIAAVARQVAHVTVVNAFPQVAPSVSLLLETLVLTGLFAILAWRMIVVPHHRQRVSTTQRVDAPRPIRTVTVRRSPQPQVGRPRHLALVPNTPRD